MSVRKSDFYSGSFYSWFPRDGTSSRSPRGSELTEPSETLPTARMVSWSRALSRPRRLALREPGPLEGCRLPSALRPPTQCESGLSTAACWRRSLKFNLAPEQNVLFQRPLIQLSLNFAMSWRPPGQPPLSTRCPREWNQRMW